MAGSTAEPERVLLPKPRTDGGKPLLSTLKERRTTRELRGDPLPPQLLSDLLWAGFGVNRPETGGRTAPSAMNHQEIDLYVATADGLFLFEPAPHALRLIRSGDLRGSTGGPASAREAPVRLVFVVDLERMVKAKAEDKERYAGIDTGYISQNLYLFCASAGLGTVVHDLDRGPLAAAMGLRPSQRIVLAQAVGFPEEKAGDGGIGSR